MIRTTFIITAMFAAWAVIPTQAEDVAIGNLQISAPWARATPKGAGVGGGYMKVTNTGTAPDRLVGGSTDISRTFEVHEMTIEGGVMIMRRIAGGLEIKPGQTIELKPGGYHIMFVGLKKQLMQGDHFTVKLEFAKAGYVNVDFSVAGIAAQTGGGDHGRPGMQMHDGKMK
jgi:copper(I)-binding protein